MASSASAAAAAAASSSSSSNIVGETLRNLTGILQDRLPGIDLKDIPGLDDDDEYYNGEGVPTPRSTNFAIFMCSLILGIFWITYITFLNSRLVGTILTRLLNSGLFRRYMADIGGYIQVISGPIRVNFISSTS